MVLKNKEIEKLLMKMTPTVPNKEEQKKKELNEVARKEAENIDKDTPDYNEEAENEEDILEDEFDSDEEEEQVTALESATTKDEEIEKQREILRKLKAEKMREAKFNKQKLEQAKSSVVDQENEKALLETIERLHNTGLFRAELLFQLQNLNVNLIKITSELEKVNRK